MVTERSCRMHIRPSQEQASRYEIQRNRFRPEITPIEKDMKPTHTAHFERGEVGQIPQFIQI